MSQEVCVHDYMAVRICGEMLKDPTAPEVRLYAKTLSNLELSRDETVREDLQTLLQQLVQVSLLLSHHYNVVHVILATSSPYQQKTK